jgi:hypothetical protein
MSHKILSEEQAAVRDRIFYESGAKGAAIGLGIGLVATALTIRKSPDFRALSKPMQAIMAASSKVFFISCYKKYFLFIYIIHYSYYFWFLICY